MPMLVNPFFFGASAPPGTVNLDGHSVTHSQPSTCYAGYRFTTGGTVEKRGPNETDYTQIDTSDWLDPKDDAPDLYEIKCTVNSGSVLGDNTGAWLALTSDREWYRSDIASVGGALTADLTIEIRHDGGDVLASNTYTLSTHHT